MPHTISSELRKCYWTMLQSAGLRLIRFAKRLAACGTCLVDAAEGRIHTAGTDQP